jgi:hypothetical protein
MTIYTLYIKTHKLTGLKYLGQTKQNPFTYSGSGVDWTDHLLQYGDFVDTKILFQSTNIEERNYWGRYYSKYFNVVNAMDDYGNKIWANRIPETGGGPGGMLGRSRGERFKEKMLIQNKGENNPMFGTIWINNGIENKKIRGEVPEGWVKGRLISSDYALKFTKRSKIGINNTRFNKTVYRFENIETLEQISSTSYEFAIKYEISTNGLRGLIRKKRPSYKGWRIIFD